jgi:hypothetical protein
VDCPADSSAAVPVVSSAAESPVEDCFQAASPAAVVSWAEESTAAGSHWEARPAAEWAAAPEESSAAVSPAEAQKACQEVPMDPARRAAPEFRKAAGEELLLPAGWE